MSGATRPAAVTYASIGVGVALVLLLAVNGAWVLSNTEQLRPIVPGDVAPSFELPEVDEEGRATGRRLTLSEHRGRVVLLDFWAEWCGPCRSMLPVIDAVHRRYRDRGFEVISIKTDGADMGRAAGAIRKADYPVVLDYGGVSEAYKVTTIPHLVLVDHLGVVRFVHRGGAHADDIAREVDRLLERARAAAAHR